MDLLLKLQNKILQKKIHNIYLFSFIFILPTMHLFSSEPKVKFRDSKISISGKILNVEVADNDERRTMGLMYREKLAPSSGMIFIFPKEKILSFWMKNTFIPLSIGFFDKNKNLVDIQEMKPVTSIMSNDYEVHKSKKPAKYALEVPKDWFKKNKIKIGAKFSWVTEK